jgi:hypothetical protein
LYSLACDWGDLFGLRRARDEGVSIRSTARDELFSLRTSTRDEGVDIENTCKLLTRDR